MNAHRLLRNACQAFLALTFCAAAQAATTDISSVPLNTYNAPSSSDVKPNIMFILDNSGSMAWGHMPDENADAGSSVPFTYGYYGARTAQCNGVYYNPAITYTAPVTATGSSYANATFSGAWNDGYNTGGGTTNLGTSFQAEPDSSSQKAYYYAYSGAQTTQAQKNYYVSTTTFAQECSSALGDPSYGRNVFSRVILASSTPATITTTLVVSGSSSTTVSSITVNGVQLMSGTSTGSTSSSTVATNVAAKITLNGFSASASSGTITITGPASAAGYLPAITKSGSMTINPDNFPTIDTNAAHLTNFANWYSYYRTRINMMKTASGLAFKDIDDRFRVGYMTINGSSFLNIANFTAANKTLWYNALYGVTPSGSTPLRTALSEVGEMYAGTISSINGVTVTDPLQYSCQQNYAILSTDGFWNTGIGYKLNGSTEVGNEDAALPRPMFDGGSATVQQRTSNLQQQVVTLQSQTKTSTLQQQSVTPQYLRTPSTLQSRTLSSVPAPSLQTRTSSDSGSTWTGWSDAGSCTVDNSGSSRRQCQYPISTSSDSGSTWTTWSYASSCTTDNSGSSRTACSGSVNNWSGWADAGSCTTSGTVQCRYNAGTTTTVTSCTAVPPSGGSPYTVASPVSCTATSPLLGSWTDVSSCTTSASTNCQYTAWSPSWSNVASCTVVEQSTAPTYTVGTASHCQTVVGSTGPWTNTSSCTTSATNNCQYTGWGSWSNVSTCTAAAQSTASPYTVGTATQCQTLTSGGSSDSLADVAAYYYNTDLRSLDPAAGTGTCTGPIIPPATTHNDLCTDNVPANGRDVASTQHMTLFTVGLGVRGRMVYSPTYWSDLSGDFWDVWKGTTANPGAGICSWQSSGACNWPGPGMSGSEGQIENVDDLWHAAVNGRGAYFNASDPDSLTSGLTSLLTTIINTPRPGTAAAAASSNPNISSSDNYVFSSSYKSVEWYGELIRQQINASSGVLSSQDWSAMTLLDTKVATNTSTRVIFFNKANALTPFLWGNLTGAQQANFQAPYLTYTSATAGLSQFCTTGGNCLSGAAQSNTTAAANGAAGENLVLFLRGDRSKEGSFYRTRIHVLGDIVSSEARYLKSPVGMVYVGANDGMLHAFSAATGDEAWAYIPSFVLPNLYKLADMNYSTQHQFFVDGSPEVGTINEGAKTILVGGLNDGGKGYYALNVTDPDAPSLMWEFTDTNMGFSYGNPRITKLADGTWVVIVTSGYNNADGLGHVYVLNANTGVLIRDIATTAGSAGTPSGLAKISAHAPVDNVVKAVYGGDLLGNVWRFDVNGNIGAAGYDAQLLVSYKDASGNPQPITEKPTVATINGKPVIFVGTGLYLGVSDVASTAQQSFYAVKDNYDAATFVTPRSAGSNFVKQTLSSTTCPAGAPDTICSPGQAVRGISGSDCQAMDWNTKNGWYMDFLTGGERSTTDSALAFGTLVFNTNIPNQASASACGSTSSTDTSASFAYAVDYQTGCSVTGSGGVAAVSLGSGLATKGILGKLAGGRIIEIIRQSGGSSSGAGTDMGNTKIVNVHISGPLNPAKRVSWRELITE